MAAKFQPVPNTGSQIERAILALLRDAYGTDGEAANYVYLFSNCSSKRTAPLIDVLAHKSTETLPRHTGIETFMVRVEWVYDGALEVGQENPDDDWKAINEFVGIGMAALSQTAGNAGDPNTLPETVASEITRLGRALATDPENHTDMKDFTCSYIEFKGSQRAEAVNGTLFLKEIRHFEVWACPSNVD